MNDCFLLNQGMVAPLGKKAFEVDLCSSKLPPQLVSITTQTYVSSLIIKYLPIVLHRNENPLDCLLMSVSTITLETIDQLKIKTIIHIYIHHSIHQTCNSIIYYPRAISFLLIQFKIRIKLKLFPFSINCQLV